MGGSDGFVTAFAPASIGNVGVGFDMLGLAIEGPGDRVAARRSPGAGVHVAGVYGTDGAAHASLPTDADRNTASIAAAALWRAHGQGGLELVVRKGIPLNSGMGSSAASAVAGVVAANALLEKPLPPRQLLRFALAGEEFAAGAVHADNVAPSLLGGLVLCPPALLPDVVALDVPQGVCSVLLHPELEVSTAESRRALSKSIPVDAWLTQQGYLAAFIAACRFDDRETLGKCLRDVVIEPQRKGQVPCFDAVKGAALDRGAYGCSLSGSGPSLFALCAQEDAEAVGAAMESACRDQGYECQRWSSPMDAPGARIEPAA